MPSLPASTDSLLVRTYFGDPDGWLRLRSVATGENADGFRAYVQVVDDEGWDDCSTVDLRAAALAGEHASVLFVVDQIAMEAGFPILVVDLSPSDRRPFRCAAAALWGVENNLNLANMDWEEFASSTDSRGVHRGFEE